ncbi:3-oxoacyl-[acyl-carrier-protein] synthase 3 [Bacteroidia bacterium]|nr:3-oxoacyl-[acyl-carrier-protein] synthase 3 [Bacteroidia bacterium]
MELFLNRIAHYVPKGIVPNSYFKELNGLDDEWIYSRTGIKNRSKVTEGENTNTMALRAVENANVDLPYDIKDVDLIVAATYSPYDTVVTQAHYVQNHYNIENAQCVSVCSACSSFINAMEIVEGYVKMGKAKKALVLASEHNTKYANETDPQSGHLWGDGAVAAFVSDTRYSENEAEILSIYTKGLGHISKAMLAVHLFPRGAGITMPEGRDVFVNACHYMIEALEKAGACCGKKLKDISYISTHQANNRIVTNIAKQLNMPEDRFLSTIEYWGNTGCPSCAITLSAHLDKIKKNDLVGLTVFGGGYSCGALLLQY